MSWDREAATEKATQHVRTYLAMAVEVATLPDKGPGTIIRRAMRSQQLIEHARDELAGLVTHEARAQAQKLIDATVDQCIAALEAELEARAGVAPLPLHAPQTKAKKRKGKPAAEDAAGE